MKRQTPSLLIRHIPHRLKNLCKSITAYTHRKTTGNNRPSPPPPPPPLVPANCRPKCVQKYSSLSLSLCITVVYHCTLQARSLARRLQWCGIMLLISILASWICIEPLAPASRRIYIRYTRGANWPNSCPAVPARSLSRVKSIALRYTRIKARSAIEASERWIAVRRLKTNGKASGCAIARGASLWLDALLSVWKAGWVHIYHAHARTRAHFYTYVYAR